MMWKNLGGISSSVRKMFDWTPTAVTMPRPEYAEYRDVGRVLLGYHVTVSYKHHKPQTYRFSIDEEKFCLSTRERALCRAVVFYQNTKRKIARENQRQR